MSTTVQEGPYYGYSQAEIDAALAKYKAARATYDDQRATAGGGSITFVSVNGKQVTYDQAAAHAHLQQWQQDLRNAQAQLSGVDQPFADRAVARFQ